LTKKTGLAVFASDALSSTAYATEGNSSCSRSLRSARIRVFIMSGTDHIRDRGVLVIVAHQLSAKRSLLTLRAGGALTSWRRQSRARRPGCCRGGLLVDYVRQFPCRSRRAVAAITSAAQGTSLAWINDHKVFLCLILIAFIAVAKLCAACAIRRAIRRPNVLVRNQFSLHGRLGLVHYYFHPTVSRRRPRILN